MKARYLKNADISQFEWCGGVLVGDTASTLSAPLLSVQVASGTERYRLLFLIIRGQATRVNAAMGGEGNETFSNGSSEPQMPRVNELLSVYTCTVLSERDLWHQPCFLECDRSGDDDEHRDEVLAVTIPPEQSEKPRHEVSGGGPERNEVE